MTMTSPDPIIQREKSSRKCRLVKSRTLAEGEKSRCRARRKPLNFREADGRLGKLSGFYFSDIAALALER